MIVRDDPSVLCATTHNRRASRHAHHSSSVVAVKRMLLVFVVAIATVACGGDDAAVPLTEPEYSAQGNAICEQMNAELDALAVQASSGVSPEDERQIFVQANEISRSAIESLFDLVPPASLADDRQVLRELVDERRQLLERLTNGEDLGEEVTEINLHFDAAARRIWPSCTR